MSTHQVTLKSQSGWQHITTLSDPIFADILASYLELDESPDEVMITGSVAEVIEQHWQWWTRISDEVEVDTSRISEDAIITASASLYQFATILNLPPKWRLFVTLDQYPQLPEERERHYIAVGGLLDDERLKRSSSDELSSHIVDNFITGANMEGEYVDLLRGMQWSASYRHNYDSCTLLEMDWDCFMNYVRSHWPAKDGEIIINTVELLLGYGDLSAPNAIQVHWSMVRSSPHQWPSLLIYDRLMSNTRGWDVIKLEEIGLSFLVDTMPSYLVYGVLNFISDIHAECLEMPRRGETLTPTFLCDMVEEMSRRLSGNSLLTVSELLRGALPSLCGEEKLRVTIFQAVLEHAINGYGRRATW